MFARMFPFSQLQNYFCPTKPGSLDAQLDESFLPPGPPVLCISDLLTLDEKFKVLRKKILAVYEVEPIHRANLLDGGCLEGSAFSVCLKDTADLVSHALPEEDAKRVNAQLDIVRTQFFKNKMDGSVLDALDAVCAIAKPSIAQAKNPELRAYQPISLIRR